MFENHFGLRENPFVSGHQSRFVYPSPEHQEALAHLRYGIANREPFVLITGEVGTGKTTAIYEELAELGHQAAVALITNSALTRSELLEEICLRFGFAVASPLTKPQAMAQLERHVLALRARGQRAILLLDEAQNLDRELLEEIRLLSNLETQGEKLIQIFLVGQPELEDKLGRPELRQLRQRIAVHYRLRPLSADDTARYIHHRVTVSGGYAPKIFPPETCAEVYRLSHGIPREINQLCSQAMIDAFVEDAPCVRPEHVRSAAGAIRFESVMPGAAQGTATAETPASAPVAAPSAATAPTPAPTPAPAPPPLAEATRPATAPPVAAAPPPPSAPAPSAASAPPPAPPCTPAPVTPEPGIPQSEESPPSAEEEAEWESWVASLVKAHERKDAGGATAPAPSPHAEEAERSEPGAGATAPPAPVSPRHHPGAGATAPPATAAPGPTAAAVRESAGAPSEPAEAAAPEPASAAAPEPVSAPAPEPLGAPDRAVVPASTLPPRLREKLAWEDEPQQEGVTSAAPRWFAAAAVIAVLAVGALLLQRFGPWSQRRTPARPATTAASAAPTHQVAQPAVATVPTVAATRESAAVVPSPVPVTTETSVPRAPEGEAPKPVAAVPVRLFALSVGTYLDERRAEAERVRLAGVTQLPGRLLTVHQDSVAMYAVVMGAFPSRDAAERTASDLIGRGLVDEARVVPRRRQKP
ncbi:MAG: AAA family ATPase [Candidatus Eisenbacteria bacterium]|nr:AAA family ATPase [Candidatus Eisenbacteria bacterium]